MNNPLKWLAWTLLIVVACWLFRTSDHQAAHWRGAYFSMAANLTPTGLFLVDTVEINRFDQLPAIGQTAYRFHRSPAHQRTEYRLMQVGYGYICALARRLWPFMGDGQAVVVLQVVVHIGCCLWLLPTGFWACNRRPGLLVAGYGLCSTRP